MRQHPFIEEFSEGIIFPSQNVPLSRKTETWKRANMDALENIGRIQYAKKERGLRKNYKLINGELLEEEYNFGDDVARANISEDEQDIIEMAAEKMGIPNFIKNYDIIGQPVRTLEGELDSLPDVFNVIGRGELFDNERQRVKTEMLREWFMQIMTDSINRQLGYESDPMFETEEEQQQYQQQFQAKTPPEVEYYMRLSYKHILEEWGQGELEDQFERFRLKAKRRTEFHHYLVSGERYRRIFTDAQGLRVESLNPIYVFSSKSPDIEYVQDGDYAGVIKVLSVPAVIDRYGHLMTDKQLNSLERPYKADKDSDYGKYLDGSPITHLSPYGVPYQTRVPSLDPNFNRYFPDMMNGVGALNHHTFMTEEELSKIDGTATGLYNTLGHQFLVVTEGYWRSQRRIGKLTTWNKRLNQLEVTIVDENYIVPPHIKEIRNELPNYNAGVDTLIWTRETQIWEGIKISNYNTDGLIREPIYLKIQPAEIQIGKLLIAGQFANNINTKPTSLVDRLKPWQFFFNILINQCYQYFSTEIAPFMVMSADMIPGNKDWGGDDALEKWLDSAREGAVIADLSPTTNGIAGLGGQFPKIVDLTKADMILSRMELALRIKQFALEQVGISPQRLGEVRAQETATGVAQAVNSSGVQTSSWFTSFFECEKDILQMQLDAAKLLQATDKEFSVQTVKSDLSVQTLKFATEEGDLYDLHVYVSDSQEELRNLELARQLALNNNTSEMRMSDRITMATSGSVRSILNQLKFSEDQAEARMQQELNLRQQELQQQGMQVEEARNYAAWELKMKLDNNIKVATIRALGNSRDNDINQNMESDVLEYVDMLNEMQNISNQRDLDNSKLELDRQKHNDEVNLKRQELRDKREERIAEQILADKKIKQATIAGDKSK